MLAWAYVIRMSLMHSCLSPLLPGVHDPIFKATSERLVGAGLEDKVFSSLRSNLVSGGPGVATGGAAASAPGSIIAAVPSSSSSPSSSSLYSRMASIIKEFGSSEGGGSAWISSVHAALREQTYKERCELLSVLLLLYELPAPLGLRCSSPRAVELVKLMSTNMFPSAATGQGQGDTEAAAEVGGTVAAAGALRRSVLGSPAAVAEQLVSGKAVYHLIGFFDSTHGALHPYLLSLFCPPPCSPAGLHSSPQHP